MNTPTGTEKRVCEDIARRQQIGIAKYGTTVEGNQLTTRQWLQHAYEETLDQAIYLRRAIEQIDARKESVDDAANSLKHIADDHPCCKETLEWVIDILQDRQR